MSNLIWTNWGLSKLAVATPEQPMTVAEIVVGDGGGVNPPINANTTAITGEWWSGAASEPIRDAALPLQLTFESPMPHDVGGTIRMVGLRDPDGKLLAVANTSTIQKPSSEGGGTPMPMTVRASIVLGNAAQVQVVVNAQSFIDHGGLSNRGAPHAHPMAAITGLTGRQSFNGSESLALPSTISGAVSLKSTAYNMRATLPKVADLPSAVEVTLYLSHDSTHPFMLRAATGDALNMPDDVKYESVPGEIILRPTGGWVTLRSVAGVGWEVVASNIHLRDPDTFKRGMPLKSSNAEVLTGEDDFKMVTPAGLAAALIRAAGIAGRAKNLRCDASGTGALVNITADHLYLESAAGQTIKLRGVNLSINTATVGANGLDKSALAGSTWYDVWVIWNGTNTAGLICLSGSAPALPEGYTHRAKVWAVRTDGTANKYPLATFKVGCKTRYKVGAGNVLALPLMVSGTQGGVNTPTFVAVSVDAFVPDGATAIELTIAGSCASTSVIAAPNPNHYGVVVPHNNAPPLHLSMGPSTATHLAATGVFLLESRNVYYASNSNPSGMRCNGWEDDL